MTETDKVVWVYESGEDESPIGYVRKGRCNGCGVCCRDRHQYGYHSEAAPGSLPFRAPRGTKGAARAGPLVAENWDGHWVYWSLLAVPAGVDCPAFDDIDRCSVFETDEWPEICRKFPMLPYEMSDYPNCGFHFEPLDTEGIPY